MTTDNLERAAERFRALAQTTAGYVLDQPAARGGIALAMAMIDAAETAAVAQAALWRGRVRPELWGAVMMLALEIETGCRAVGNDGQLTRLAGQCAALAAAWDGFARSLAEEEAKTRHPEQPDPNAPASGDDRLTEAIAQTFPASDPTAVPGVGRADS